MRQAGTAAEAAPIHFAEQHTAGDLPAGLCLGADFCAEHEFGIEGIRDLLGIGKAAQMGIQARRITIIPQNAIVVAGSAAKADLALYVEAGCLGTSRWEIQSERTDELGIHYVTRIPERISSLTLFRQSLVITEPFPSHPTIRKGPLKAITPKTKEEKALYLQQTSGFYTAWDQDGFLARARGAEAVSLLSDIIDAFRRKDLLVSLGRATNPFGRGGLNLVIASRVPEAVCKQVLDMDQDADRLQGAAAATGIEARLKAAGLKWFSLKPRWANKEKTEITWWLNPVDQNRYQSGWMSLQELEDWARGEGAVFKERPQASVAR